MHEIHDQTAACLNHSRMQLAIGVGTELRLELVGKHLGRRLDVLVALVLVFLDLVGEGGLVLDRIFRHFSIIFRSLYQLAWRLVSRSRKSPNHVNFEI